MIVTDLLVEHFPGIVDVGFTVKMEQGFDDIAEGNVEWRPLIKEFYVPFAEHLEQKYAEVGRHEFNEETSEVCKECAKPMIIKRGRFGKFLACTGFPDCKYTKTLKKEPEKIGMSCPECKTGGIIIRFTKTRKLFYGCSNYPQCNYGSWEDPRKNAIENPEKPENSEKEEKEHTDDEEI